MGHGLAQEPDYRSGNMYAAQVQPNPAASYGAPAQQMYGEMEGIYGYPPMQAQQVIPHPSSVPPHSLGSAEGF